MKSLRSQRVFSRLTIGQELSFLRNRILPASFSQDGSHRTVMNNIKRATPALLILLLSSSVAFAQSIKGRLLSARDGETLGSGGISVNDNKAYSLIDIDGRFRMALPDTATQIVFHYVGYSSFRMNIPRHKDTLDLGDVYMFSCPLAFDMPKSGTFTRPYESGETEIVFSLKRWKLDGPYTEFYKNGEKRVEGMYKKGMKNGKWTYRKADGKAVVLTFEEDVLVRWDVDFASKVL